MANVYYQRKATQKCCTFLQLILLCLPRRTHMLVVARRETKLNKKLHSRNKTLLGYFYKRRGAQGSFTPVPPCHTTEVTHSLYLSSSSQTRVISFKVYVGRVCNTVYIKCSELTPCWFVSSYELAGKHRNTQLFSKLR